MKDVLQGYIKKLGQEFDSCPACKDFQAIMAPSIFSNQALVLIPSTIP